MKENIKEQMERSSQLIEPDLIDSFRTQTTADALQTGYIVKKGK